MKIEKRESYGYLATGIILGIVLGLLTAWYWYPVQRIDTFPATLRTDFKLTYRELIAAAFSSNGDVGRARSRLTLLADDDAIGALSSQAQLSLASNGSGQSARELGLLAAALSENSTPNPGPTQTATPNASTGTAVVVDLTAGIGPTNASGTPEISQTVLPTATITPTITPTATGGAPFAVEIFSEVCDPSQPGPLIMVYVFDSARRPVPGVEVVVTWETGQDSFYTGLKPEIDLGYADFSMDLGVSYTVALTMGDQPVSGFSTRECETQDGVQAFSSWEIIFVQP